MLKNGIYEQLINTLIKRELDAASTDNLIEKSSIGSDESSKLLTSYLREIIKESNNKRIS